MSVLRNDARCSLVVMLAAAVLWPAHVSAQAQSPQIGIEARPLVLPFSVTVEAAVPGGEGAAFWLGEAAARMAALAIWLTAEERTLAKQFLLLTDKPTIFACNVTEADLATADSNPYVKKVREYVETHLACEAVVISAQIESDLVDLSPEEGSAFLKELGVEESGIGALIRSTYHLLGLQTYFTAGEKEVRAWTIRIGDTAPNAAGVIHSDFERGFIKAETVAFDDLVVCGSIAAAREKGLYRMEGKEYVVADGDVLLFKFNV